MSEHHNTNTGPFGLIIGFLSYVFGSAFNFFPDAGHFIPAIITAGCCTALGFLVTKFMGWCWMKLGNAYTDITIRISSVKKGSSFFKLFSKKK